MIRRLLMGPMLAALVVLAACAGPQAVRGSMHYGMADAPEGQRLLWPQAPEVPRFLYAGTLTGEQNFRRSEADSGLKAFGRWLVGLDGRGEAPVVLQRPAAVIGDEQGRLFVSDTSRQAVFVFDEKAGELQVWERAEGLANFVAPSGLALAPQGGLFVADAELGHRGAARCAGRAAREHRPRPAAAAHRSGARRRERPAVRGRHLCARHQGVRRQRRAGAA